MSEKLSKQIGFFSALCILLGSVVGIGIFFKNGSVSRGVNGDGYGWLAAWIIGGIISLCAAVSFSEIGRFKHKRISGLSSWAVNIYGKKFGHFVAIGFSVFYLGLDAIAISYFAVEFFWIIVGGTPFHNTPALGIFVNLLIAIVLLSFLLFIKNISIKTTGIIQSVTTVLKFLPLIFAVGIGIYVYLTSGPSDTQNAFIVGKGLADPTGTRIIRVFAVLPAVLFAYDSFLNVASMTNRVRNGEKRMPLIIGLGMLVIAILYTLVGLSSVISGESRIDGMLRLLTSDESTKSALSFTLNIFIFISAFGVTNGMTAVLDSDVRNLCKLGVFYGSKRLYRKYGESTGLIYTSIILAFWFLMFLTISLSVQSDAFIDGFSNFPTVVFFLIYATLILGYSFQRERYPMKKINSVAFYLSAVSAVVGIYLAQTMWFISQINDIRLSDHSTIGWGASLTNGLVFPTYIPLITLLLYIAMIFIGHYTNIYLTKRYEKRDVLATINTERYDM